MNNKSKPLCPAQIDEAFSGAADLCRRPLRVGGQDGMFYFLDGLTSGGDVAETILRPLARLSESFISPRG